MDPSPWLVAPFGLLLLCVAVLPLVAASWWHSNRNKAIVAGAAGLPVAVAVALSSPGALAHAALEYATFIALMGSLFVVSGNLRLTGRLSSSTAANAGLLAFGAVLANLVGTTGASMLLIRPLLDANRGRRSRAHLVVFFLLIVSNCGGCLTPIGDPPLFLGFLKGVPFAWTLTLWKEWAILVGALLAAFAVWDRRSLRADPPAADSGPREPLGLQGRHNLLFLAAVVGTVLLGGFWLHPRFGETASALVQAALMGAIAAASLASTSRTVREANGFSWHPLVEVVVLFAGIFAAMIPALELLRARGPGLGLDRPWQYFWATGALSAVLDNAPTYLAFHSMAQFLPDEVAGVPERILQAISCGAVFFGAASYIGNGPNFMVKAIAEERGVTMPSFFGYSFRALALLLPLFVLLTLLFFRN